jgi:signal transduction histidine kinase
MDLRWLEKRLDPSQAHLLEKMRGMIGLTDQTIQRVQKISSELRPRMLDDLGLAAAIEWLMGDFSRRTGIRCKTAVQVTQSRIGGNSATAIYRIVQEVLTNISRHANASRASVLLREVDERLEVLIRDDGIGISETQATDARSFGLIGIRERAQGLGGNVSIRGETGKGTTVAISIPYPGGGNLE